MQILRYDLAYLGSYLSHCSLEIIYIVGNTDNSVFASIFMTTCYNQHNTHTLKRTFQNINMTQD
jgi:hypothetical protein